MRRKKSPRLGQIADHVEALQKTLDRSRDPWYALEELRREAGHLAPRQLTPLIPAALLAGWRKRLAPWTAWHRRHALLRGLRYLRNFGAPRIDLPRMPRPQSRGVTATPDQIQQLLRAAAPWQKLFILLCWQTALRFSEALAVSPQNYDAAAHVARIPVKGHKQRTILLTPEIEELLAVAVRSDPTQTCVSALHGKPISREGVRKAWRLLLKKAGLPPDSIRPHDLRRTTATALYAVSKDLRAVQQYLGHRHIASTAHYIAPLTEESMAQYQAMLQFVKAKPATEVKQ